MSNNIKEILEKLGTSPKKSMGQNFLINKHKIQKITKEIIKENCKSIVEIGPGLGSITNELVKINTNLLCIEKDKDFFEYLKRKYEHYDNFEIYNKDILKCNLKKLGNGKRIFFGNLPYNIGTKIIESLNDNFHSNDNVSAIFMLQKEVGEKILSKKGSKTYNGFVVKIRTFYKVKKLLELNESDFWPQPKIKSILLRFDVKRINAEDRLDYKDFSNFIFTSFSIRRKKLTNNLQKKFKKSLIIEKLKLLDLSEDVRAQDIEVETFMLLYKMLKDNKL
tara:strand:+ start:10424 stop:11257 length:834 start_codon:yes stop_codon:yes gene_type:complete